MEVDAVALEMTLALRIEEVGEESVEVVAVSLEEVMIEGGSLEGLKFHFVLQDAPQMEVLVLWKKPMEIKHVIPCQKNTLFLTGDSK